MVDQIKPIYHTRRLTPTNSKVPESNEVEAKTDEKDAEPYIVTKDRRKGHDRRDRRGEKRGMYDMRSGKDRRKGGDSPSIEIKV
ncbi:hypothetical protein TDB9533_04156 [Thalassocella blandensis]|nr:hypothetical protein TDB9533_04156 [Thalassocella blandensis]